MSMRSILVPLILTSAAFATAPPTALPHVLREHRLGGEGGWDYLSLDASARRLYIARSTHVMVVDADSGKVVGDLPDTPGVHGVALAPDLGMGFTSNGRTASVTCFDLKTLKVVRVIQPTGAGPDAILYDPFSKRVFTFNGSGRSVTAINATSGAIEGTLGLGATPEFAVTDGAGRIFVNLEDKAQVAVFGAKDLKLQAEWPMAGIEEPTGLAYDASHGRIYSTGRNAKVAVLDTKTGKPLAILPSGEGSDAAEYDAASGRTFVSNGAGTLTVLEGLKVLGNVPTARGARTMAFDPKTHHLFLATSEYVTPDQVPGQPKPRPAQVPGSFKLLEVGP